jgi:hypothetical protein
MAAVGHAGRTRILRPTSVAKTPTAAIIQIVRELSGVIFRATSSAAKKFATLNARAQLGGIDLA